MPYIAIIGDRSDLLEQYKKAMVSKGYEVLFHVPGLRDGTRNLYENAQKPDTIIITGQPLKEPFIGLVKKINVDFPDANIMIISDDMSLERMLKDAGIIHSFKDPEKLRMILGHIK